jgi:hypothetical protein
LCTVPAYLWERAGKRKDVLDGLIVLLPLQHQGGGAAAGAAAGLRNRCHTHSSAACRARAAKRCGPALRNSLQAMRSYRNEANVILCARHLAGQEHRRLHSCFLWCTGSAIHTTGSFGQPFTMQTASLNLPGCRERRASEPAAWLCGGARSCRESQQMAKKGANTTEYAIQ